MFAARDEGQNGRLGFGPAEHHLQIRQTHHAVAETGECEIPGPIPLERVGVVVPALAIHLDDESAPDQQINPAHAVDLRLHLKCESKIPQSEPAQRFGAGLSSLIEVFEQCRPRWQPRECGTNHRSGHEFAVQG